MKTLTLIRHAKSDWTSAALSDFDRPLNARGNKAAPVMGLRMLERRSIPDLLVSSPARRAQQTAGLLAEALGLDAQDVLYHRDIYDARLATLISLVRDLPDCGHLALIGHNPGLSDLANWLCSDTPEWLPTGAVVELELPVERWHNLAQGIARLRCYDYPKKPQGAKGGHADE